MINSRITKKDRIFYVIDDLIKGVETIKYHGTTINDESVPPQGIKKNSMQL